MDVAAFVVLFHPEDVAGMEPAVSRMLSVRPLQELLGRLAQGQEGLPHRLQAVAYSVSSRSGSGSPPSCPAPRAPARAGRCSRSRGCR